MEKITLFTLESLYRDNFSIEGFRFGSGEKTVCIVGAMRGNEMQQLFMCSHLVRTLKRLEADDRLVPGKQILVVPCVNPFSINTGKRFWAVDNTDINRMFPGYDKGETTQRIAAGLFDQINDFEYGIQTVSFYLPGNLVPHVRVLDTGSQDLSLAKHFGLPYAVSKKPSSFDTVTLNYNWQCWGVKAFSVFSRTTDRVDIPSARQCSDGIIRFLTHIGVLNLHPPPGCATELIHEENLMPLSTEANGFLHSKKHTGDFVIKNEAFAEVSDPLTGEVIDTIHAPCDGVVFFEHNKPLVSTHDIAFRLVPSD